MVDPVSAAAGAAVGAAGKAVSKAAEDPKLRNALLLPVVTVIGKAWARDAEEYFERRTAKRLENLGRHVDEAIRINGREKIEAIEGDTAFHEWADGVSKVDPADEELSAIWQSALTALQRRGLDRLTVLSIARVLRPDEAATFLLFFQARARSPLDWLLRGPELPREYKNKFSELGLIQTRLSREVNHAPRTLTYISLVLVTGLIYAAVYAGVTNKVFDRWLAALGLWNVVAIAMMIFTVSVFAYPFLNSYVPTPKGEMLLRSIPRTKP